MPRILQTPEVTAVGLGAVDEFTEYLDRKRGYAHPFRNITDWTRVLAGALGAYWFSRGEQMDYAVPMLYAESFAATKSVSRLIRSGFSGTAAPAERWSIQNALGPGSGAINEFAPGAGVREQVGEEQFLVSRN